MYSKSARKLRLVDVYKNIFPWRSFNDFFAQITSTIAYRSPDDSLIAICKPFGVGTYAADDKNTSMQNQDKLLYQLSGHSKYCLQDILDPLTQHFGSKKPYKILKGIDRYMSGLVLLTNDYEEHRKDYLRSTAKSRSLKQPPFGFRAITSGYPVIPGNEIYEQVGMEFVELDELGDYKEPIIKQDVNTRRFRVERDKDTYQAELIVKRINRETSSSLVELYCCKLRSDFPRCYISSKTSFILGDVHFSKRIREILGKPIQVSAFKSSHIYDDNYEPLNCKLRDLLGVHKNASIPLMLDLHVLRLKGFERKKRDKSSRDLFIQSPFMPAHFALTAGRLNLLDGGDEVVGLSSRSSYNYDAGLDSIGGGDGSRVGGGSGKGTGGAGVAAASSSSASASSSSSSFSSDADDSINCSSSSSGSSCNKIDTVA